MYLVGGGINVKVIVWNPSCYEPFCSISRAKLQVTGAGNLACCTIRIVQINPRMCA